MGDFVVIAEDNDVVLANHFAGRKAVVQPIGHASIVDLNDLIPSLESARGKVSDSV